MRFAGRWLLTAGLRHDTARTSSTDRLLGARTEDTARAVTGNAGLMFDLTTWARPYISYATSFLPNSGTDVDGSTFKPETGRQAELGIKFDLPNKSGLLTLAMFDLTRRNVLSSDPVNTDFSIATGEQRTRGLEAELTADLGGG